MDYRGWVSESEADSRADYWVLMSPTDVPVLEQIEWARQRALESSASYLRHRQVVSAAADAMAADELADRALKARAAFARRNP